MTESVGVYTIVMPKLGLTMTQATLVRWYKRDGELVEKGEMLFALESDKAILEIEAPASGMLRVLVPAGETVPVQEPVAQLLQTAGATLSSVATVSPKPMPATGETPQRRPATSPATAGQSAPSEPAQGSIRASPKARVMARRRGLSLQGVQGTGPRGMIVTADLDGARVAAAASPASEEPIRATPVARKMAQEAGLQLERVIGSGPHGQITRNDVEKALTAARAARERPLHEPPPEARVQQLTGLRATIARRLSAAWHERPQVTLTTEAEATNLVSARQQVIAETGGQVADSEEGARVSYDAFLVVLVARALREQPHVNVRLTDAGVEQVAQINIGVAVDTDRGLLVPVIRDAASKGLLEIQRALQDLAKRAKAGTLLPDDLTGGTFTITNLGMYEIDAFTPIINPPECAILGVGRILPKPVASDGQVVVRQMVALSLSFDHRLIDGAPAARFLQRVKQLVERPFALSVLE